MGGAVGDGSGVVACPLFAIVLRCTSNTTCAVDARDFRLTVTLIAAVPLVLLVFLRTHLADKDRAQLLAKSESSIENLQRLQAQLVQIRKTDFVGPTGGGSGARNQ